MATKKTAVEIYEALAELISDVKGGGVSPSSFRDQLEDIVADGKAIGLDIKIPEHEISDLTDNYESSYQSSY